MEKLKNIDLEIGIQLDLLNHIADTLTLQKICEFKVLAEIKEIPWEDLNYPGVYFIEMKNNNKFDTFDLWAHDFKLEWENEKYLRKFVPNVKKKRMLQHSQLNEWIPLYIGKSKNIRSRVSEHIYLDLQRNTFALKLLARENLKEDTFRLSTIRIDVDHYDWIVPVIETKLRNRINPIVGKQ